MLTERKALKVKEVAEAIGLHPNTVYQLIASGRLPHIKIGKKKIIPIECLEEWLRKGAEKDGVG